MASKAGAWIFPERNGGIDVVNDALSAHFRDQRIAKLVREVLQNAVDARDDDKPGPVTVSFMETQLSTDTIDGKTLLLHVESCLSRAKEMSRPQLQKFYENAVGVLKADHLRCLSVIDSNTTGLVDRKWSALVLQEGAVEKSQTGVPGGSTGTGKNAVFNVSDIRTVLYSTRYIDFNVKKGRVERLQGKASLMAHPAPRRVGARLPGRSKDLQHVGFYKSDAKNELSGPEVPDVFRLDDTGTGVFILGFNPHARDWKREVASAIVENFFYAVHNRQLVVTVEDVDNKSIDINYETIDNVYGSVTAGRRRSRKQNAAYYYKAIRDKPSKATPDIDRLGKLDVFLLLGEGPRRIACVNRNGMLITDSADQRINPIGPRGRGLWPDYAAVVVPASDDGDRWLRTMENPSHDCFSPDQLDDPKEQEIAKKVLKKGREALFNLIDQEANVDLYGDTTNLEELATMLPELNPNEAGNRALNVREVQPSKVGPTGSVEDVEGTRDPITQPDPTPNPEPEPSPTPPNPSDDPPEPKRPKGGARLSAARIIYTGTHEAVLAFTPIGATNEAINVILRPAGAERESEQPIHVTEAKLLSGEHQLSITENGRLVLSPVANERVQIKITTKRRVDDLAVTLA